MLSQGVIILCVKVFFCRIVDVSMATFRTMLIVKGKTALAACIAIVEAMVWFLVIREALNFDTTNTIEIWNIAIAYALGFSSGNVLGSILSKKISGTIKVQVVTSSRNDEMIKAIQAQGFALSITKGEASQFSGEKYIIYAAIQSNRLDEFKQLVEQYDQKPFIMVSETKIIQHSVIK